MNKLENLQTNYVEKKKSQTEKDKSVEEEL